MKETEDDTAAITVYLKRDTNVEADRDLFQEEICFQADKHYVVALSHQLRLFLQELRNKECYDDPCTMKAITSLQISVAEGGHCFRLYYYVRRTLLISIQAKRLTDNIPESVNLCCCESAELVYNDEKQSANSGISTASVGDES